MNLRVLLSSLLLPAISLIACVSAGAVDLTGSTPPNGLQGLLEAPSLFGSGPCTPRTGGKYVLRVAPNDTAASAGTLEAPPIAAGQNACSDDILVPRVRKPGDAWTSPVPTREFKRGQPGLIVTDQQQNWVRIMLVDGEAWLQAPQTAGVHDYGSIVLLEPIHTLHGWDGRVCTTPHLNDCRKMSMPANPALRITRMQTFGYDLWFQVEFGISRCEGATTSSSKVLTGWIPAFGPPEASGKRPLTVWMDPHGC
ncbi:MAG TPA: hypothetical protein VK660_07840 [Xanthomonadaceae bacterium]|jgi:hypothetical protein|nr:hypothetical protein [Xanthomonadaceae bacterium]